MKSVAAILALAGSAAAFAPTEVARTSTATKAFANDMVGGEGPEPIPFSPTMTSINFDPAGFAEVRIIISSFNQSIIHCQMNMHTIYRETNT